MTQPYRIPQQVPIIKLTISSQKDTYLIFIMPFFKHTYTSGIKGLFHGLTLLLVQVCVYMSSEVFTAHIHKDLDYYLHSFTANLLRAGSIRFLFKRPFRYAKIEDQMRTPNLDLHFFCTQQRNKKNITRSWKTVYPM